MEGKEAKHKKQDAFWASIIGKYEERNANLEKELLDLQERVDQMEVSMPAVMTFNMTKLAKNTPNADVNSLINNLPCNCPVKDEKKPLPLPDMSKISVFSIEDPDIHYMDMIKELTEQEKKLIDDVNKLRSKEKALKNTKKKVDEFASSPKIEQKDGGVDSKSLQYMNERLLDENRRLADELSDLKLELKHVRENLEGPMNRELDRERRKKMKLESDLKDLLFENKNKNLDNDKEAAFLKTQIEGAEKNLKDLTNINSKLKEEIDLLNFKIQELQNELINQKLSEANTIATLKAEINKQKKDEPPKSDFFDDGPGPKPGPPGPPDTPGIPGSPKPSSKEVSAISSTEEFVSAPIEDKEKESSPIEDDKTKPDEDSKEDNYNHKKELLDQILDRLEDQKEEEIERKPSTSTKSSDVGSSGDFAKTSYHELKDKDSALYNLIRDLSKEISKSKQADAIPPEFIEAVKEVKELCDLIDQNSASEKFEDDENDLIPEKDMEKPPESIDKPVEPLMDETKAPSTEIESKQKDASDAVETLSKTESQLQKELHKISIESQTKISVRSGELPSKKSGEISHTKIITDSEVGLSTPPPKRRSKVIEPSLDQKSSKSGEGEVLSHVPKDDEVSITKKLDSGEIVTKKPSGALPSEEKVDEPSVTNKLDSGEIITKKPSGALPSEEKVDEASVTKKLDSGEIVTKKTSGTLPSEVKLEPTDVAQEIVSILTNIRDSGEEISDNKEDKPLETVHPISSAEVSPPELPKEPDLEGTSKIPSEELPTKKSSDEDKPVQLMPTKHSKSETEYVEKVQVITDLETIEDLDIETEVKVVKTSSDGINITTTVTRSGCIEITTQGPSGLIETTLTVTSSGNIEVITEFSENLPDEELDEIHIDKDKKDDEDLKKDSNKSERKKTNFSSAEASSNATPISEQETTGYEEDQEMVDKKSNNNEDKEEETLDDQATALKNLPTKKSSFSSKPSSQKEGLEEITPSPKVSKISSKLSKKSDQVTPMRVASKDLSTKKSNFSSKPSSQKEALEDIIPSPKVSKISSKLSKKSDQAIPMEVVSKDLSLIQEALSREIDKIVEPEQKQTSETTLSLLEMVENLYSPNVSPSMVSKKASHIPEGTSKAIENKGDEKLKEDLVTKIISTTSKPDGSLAVEKPLAEDKKSSLISEPKDMEQEKASEIIKILEIQNVSLSFETKQLVDESKDLTTKGSEVAFKQKGYNGVSPKPSQRSKKSELDVINEEDVVDIQFSDKHIEEFVEPERDIPKEISSKPSSEPSQESTSLEKSIESTPPAVDLTKSQPEHPQASTESSISTKSKSSQESSPESENVAGKPLSSKKDEEQSLSSLLKSFLSDKEKGDENILGDLLGKILQTDLFENKIKDIFKENEKMKQIDAEIEKIKDRVAKTKCKCKEEVKVNDTSEESESDDETEIIDNVLIEDKLKDMFNNKEKMKEIDSGMKKIKDKYTCEDDVKSVSVSISSSEGEVVVVDMHTKPKPACICAKPNDCLKKTVPNKKESEIMNEKLEEILKNELDKYPCTCEYDCGCIEMLKEVLKYRDQNKVKIQENNKALLIPRINLCGCTKKSPCDYIDKFIKELENDYINLKENKQSDNSKSDGTICYCEKVIEPFRKENLQKVETASITTEEKSVATIQDQQIQSEVQQDVGTEVKADNLDPNESTKPTSKESLPKTGVRSERRSIEYLSPEYVKELIGDILEKSNFSILSALENASNLFKKSLEEVTNNISDEDGDAEEEIFETPNASDGEDNIEDDEEEPAVSNKSSISSASTQYETDSVKLCTDVKSTSRVSIKSTISRSLDKIPKISSKSSAKGRFSVTEDIILEESEKEDTYINASPTSQPTQSKTSEEMKCLERSAEPDKSISNTSDASTSTTKVYSSIKLQDKSPTKIIPEEKKSSSKIISEATLDEFILEEEILKETTTPRDPSVFINKLAVQAMQIKSFEKLSSKVNLPSKIDSTSKPISISKSSSETKTESIDISIKSDGVHRKSFVETLSNKENKTPSLKSSTHSKSQSRTRSLTSSSNSRKKSLSKESSFIKTGSLHESQKSASTKSSSLMASGKTSSGVTTSSFIEQVTKTPSTKDASRTPSRSEPASTEQPSSEKAPSSKESCEIKKQVTKSSSAISKDQHSSNCACIDCLDKTCKEDEISLSEELEMCNCVGECNCKKIWGISCKYKDESKDKSTRSEVRLSNHDELIIEEVCKRINSMNLKHTTEPSKKDVADIISNEDFEKTYYDQPPQRVSKDGDSKVASKEILELQEVVNKIKCSCRQAEAVSGEALIKQASKYNTSISGLQVALNYFSEKSKVKDQLIDALKRELSPDFTSKFTEHVIDGDDSENDEINKDFDRIDLCESLPKTYYEKLEVFGRSPYICTCDGESQEASQEACECLVDPIPLKILDVRRIGPTSLLIKWLPSQNKQIFGYEICVNDITKSRAFSVTRNSAIVDGLKLKSTQTIAIYAVGPSGRCLPAAMAEYRM